MIHTPAESGVVPDAHGFSVNSPDGLAYRVDIDRDVLSPSNPRLASYLADRQVLAVTGPTVGSLYGPALRAYLQQWLKPGSWSTHVIATGEQNKTMASVEQVCSVAKDRGLDRHGVMLAVGGGITSDIVGFAAALYARGVRYVRLNTTLVAQVDVGVGVKTGVNAFGAKNMLGTYYAPHGSISDPGLLGTLPRRQIRCGLGEIVKMAIIRDAGLFELLEREPGIFSQSPPPPGDRGDRGAHDGRGDRGGREDHVLRRSMELMLRELCPNLRETELARVVDFGHTFSPAIETGSGYRVAHGEAVAVDMAISSHLARRLGLIDGPTCARILALLRALGLPVFDARTCRTELMRSAMASAWSRRGRRLHLVVPGGIGSARFVDDLGDVPDTLLEEVLRDLAAEPAADPSTGQATGPVTGRRQTIGAGRR